jgi:hypothetical protein
VELALERGDIKGLMAGGHGKMTRSLKVEYSHLHANDYYLHAINGGDLTQCSQ